LSSNSRIIQASASFFPKQPGNRVFQQPRDFSSVPCNYCDEVRDHPCSKLGSSIFCDRFLLRTTRSGVIVVATGKGDGRTGGKMKLFRFLGFAVLALIIATGTTAIAQKQQPRPFWGNAAGEVTFGNPGVCTTQPVQTLTSAKGQLTHLGNAMVTTTHCASADGLLALDGHATFTAANGDQVFASYTSHTTAPPPPLIVQEGELIITGGTGRFEHATGRVPFTVYVSPISPPSSDAKWPIRFVFAGTITY